MVEHDVDTCLELEDLHPPGDNSRHDVLRLDQAGTWTKYVLVCAGF
jgi:hypothetical protein